MLFTSEWKGPTVSIFALCAKGKLVSVSRKPFLLCLIYEDHSHWTRQNQGASRHSVLKNKEKEEGTALALVISVFHCQEAGILLKVLTRIKAWRHQRGGKRGRAFAATTSKEAQTSTAFSRFPDSGKHTQEYAQNESWLFSKQNKHKKYNSNLLTRSHTHRIWVWWLILIANLILIISMQNVVEDTFGCVY